MIGRIRAVLRELLISVDQLAQTAIVGLAFILHLTDHRPSADETISSYVGRAQLRGRAWATPIAAIIDGLFQLLGEEPGHCIRNIEPAFLPPA